MSVHYTRPARPTDLLHYGVKGMKWYVRRYQNYDGTLTPAGAKRLGRIETQQYNNRKKRAKYAKQYDEANTRNTRSIFKSVREQKEATRRKDMAKASKAVSELDLKERRLEKRKRKLTGHTNKPITGIDLNVSTKNQRATDRSQKWLYKQGDRQSSKGISAAEKFLKAQKKGDTKKMEKWKSRGQSYVRNLNEIGALSTKINSLSKSKGQKSSERHDKVMNHIRDGKLVIETALGLSNSKEVPKDFYSLVPEIRDIQLADDAARTGNGMKWVKNR